MTKRVTTISCSRCGWVRNVAMGAPEGPIRQLYAHAAEEHPADLAAREEEPPARFEIAPERSIVDLIREGLIVPASEFAP